MTVPAFDLRSALALEGDATPFPWQERLFGALREGRIPAALDIPTGLGKTAVMSIWLVARALGAPVPRRLIYVVDRRAVVDQATSEAERLRRLVDTNAEAKKALGLDGPLPISTLRGQHVDNHEWLQDPASPAIIVGTVDMIGSRLLFEGYGVSRKMRPYHAGLLGADALIVLDEAHLVPPFERLIEQIASGKDARGFALGPADEALCKLVPPFQVMSLSATGRDRAKDSVLRLDAEDRRHKIVKKRLSAEKRVTVLDEVDAKALPEALSDSAWSLLEGGVLPRRIVVFCTSRDHAQSVMESLETRARKAEIEIDAELFVGGRRVRERERVADWLDEHGFLAGRGVKLERPAVVVATAAGEVGVDFDAEHAVCDVVAWERMVQRLGRVNRRGEGAARVLVVPTSPTKDVDQREERHAAALEIIKQLRTSGSGFDASPAALLELRERSASDAALETLVGRATTPALLHPPLTRALVEAWSMTSLEEHTGRPEVAPWIRGWPEEEEEPQTTVVWREELPVALREEKRELLGKRELEVFIDAAGPHLAEQLETETWRVVDWLEKRLKRIGAPTEGEPGLETSSLAIGDPVAVFLRSDRDPQVLIVLKEPRKREELLRMLSGSTVLVDRRLGGLRDGLLAADSEEATDVSAMEPEPGETRRVPFRVRRVGEAGAVSLEGWRVEASIPVFETDEGATEWILIESLAGYGAQSEEGRSGAKRAQLLDEHEEWTESQAKQLAGRLGLSPEFQEVLVAAARLHDEGKRAAHWQRAFKAPVGAPYAKTTARPNIQLLEGYRHELGSLPYAEAHARIRSLGPELRALALHLIAAHHGHARPLIRTKGATEPPTRLAARAQEIALRFAQLEQRWGPWGLAWWESLLRAADQQASRRNDLEGGARG